MTLQEIKDAVVDGEMVHWQCDGYVVVCDKHGQWFITCLDNGHSIGLTWQDGVTLNAKEDDFYIAE